MGLGLVWAQWQDRAEGSWGHCQALLEAWGQTDMFALTDGRVLQHGQTFISSGADSWKA